MGVDIHMFIVKDKKTLKEDIFEGRNSEWFQNLQGHSITDEAYDHLTFKYGWKQTIVPDELIQKYSKDAEKNGYYGHRMITVADYIYWFRHYNPDLTAGWVTVYDAWAYRIKHIIPEEIYHNLKAADLAPADAEFIEINLNGCSTWLYDYLQDDDIPGDAWVIFCFDC